jgi:predicted component of type VI protein secretion system
MDDVKLIVEKGPARTRMVHVRHEETIVGRRRDCDLCIPSAEVSRRHCIIRYTNGQLSIEDLDSANGTYVNGQRLTGKQAVRHGDRVQIGPLTFRAQLGAEEPAAAGNDVFNFTGPAAAPEEELEAVILPEEEIDAIVLPEEEEFEAVVLEESGPIPVEVEVDDVPAKTPPAPPPTILTDGPGDELSEDFEIALDEDEAMGLPEGDKLRDLLSGMDH